MRQLHAVSAADVRIALQVHAELFVGAAKSANPTQAKARVTAFLAPFTLVCPDAQVEDHYVAIARTWRRKACPSAKRTCGLPPQPVRTAARW